MSFIHRFHSAFAQQEIQTIINGFWSNFLILFMPSLLPNNLIDWSVRNVNDEACEKHCMRYHAKTMHTFRKAQSSKIKEYFTNLNRRQHLLWHNFARKRMSVNYNRCRVIGCVLQVNFRLWLRTFLNLIIVSF